MSAGSTPAPGTTKDNMDKLDTAIAFHEGFILGLEDVKWYATAPPERAVKAREVNLPIPTIQEALDGLRDVVTTMESGTVVERHMAGRIAGMEYGMEIM